MISILTHWKVFKTATLRYNQLSKKHENLLHIPSGDLHCFISVGKMASLSLLLKKITNNISQYLQSQMFSMCSRKFYSSDKETQCRLKNFDFDRNIPRIKEFMRCALQSGYQWIPQLSDLFLIIDNVIRDLKPRAGGS